MTEFDLTLTNSEICSFLKQIKVEKEEPSSQLLEQIVAGIVEHVPFQNLTMLTGPRHRPTNNWIKTEMLSGLGGLCTARNPFLYAVLQQLGFDVRFVSSTITEPDCHICLVVTVSGHDWWVDVGNGYPYFTPIRLGDNSVKVNWFFQYRLVHQGNRFAVQHAFSGDDWLTNQHFSPEGVHFSVFDRMHELHYTKPGWGPFLTGLRVNRFWSDGGAVLKDHQATSPNGSESITTPRNLLNWLKQWFEPEFWNHIDVHGAWDNWKHATEALE